MSLDIEFVTTLVTSALMYPDNNKAPTTRRMVPIENNTVANSMALYGTLGGGLWNYKIPSNKLLILGFFFNTCISNRLSLGFYLIVFACKI